MNYCSFDHIFDGLFAFTRPSNLAKLTINLSYQKNDLKFEKSCSLYLDQIKFMTNQSNSDEFFVLENPEELYLELDVVIGQKIADRKNLEVTVSYEDFGPDCKEKFSFGYFECQVQVVSIE